jgi:hypothetical protein
MEPKPEIFAVIWFDRLLGLNLHLPRESAAAAIETAESMRQKDAAAGPTPMLHDVRAVHLPAGSDSLVFLEKA